jgi:predicted alpha/beta-hydrolase family hydrolase
MFVHASKDPFGTPDELRSALDAIQAPTRVVLVENARHELLTDNNTDTLPGVVVSEFRGFFGSRTKAA